MNKKTIKYLTWIILIVAILILIPIKETRAADVSHSTFKQSENHFCLNKGYPFHGTEKFNTSSISSGTFTFPNDNNKTADTDVLKYIISESVSGKYGNRESVANFTPQKAIWKLAGVTGISSSEADTLNATAYAYNTFVSTTRPVPKVVKEGTDKLVIYYYEATGTYNGVNGSYTNLLVNNISITGASYSDTESGTYTGGYNRKRIYTKNEGQTHATVKYKYETSRWANLELYTSKENSKDTLTKIGLRLSGS